MTLINAKGDGMKEGTKVVMTEQMIGISFSDDQSCEEAPREGLIFEYRGKTGAGLHEFAPDYMHQGHNIGFQIDDETFHNRTFQLQFKVVCDWGERFDEDEIADWLKKYDLLSDDELGLELIDCPEQGLSSTYYPEVEDAD